MAPERQLVLTPAAMSPFTSGTGEYNPAAHPVSSMLFQELAHPTPIISSQKLDSRDVQRDIMIDPYAELYEDNGVGNIIFQFEMYYEALRDRIDTATVANTFGISMEEAVAKKNSIPNSLALSEPSINHARLLWSLRDVLVSDGSQRELPNTAKIPRMSTKPVLFYTGLMNSLQPVFEGAERLVQQADESLSVSQREAKTIILEHQAYMQNNAYYRRGLTPAQLTESAFQSIKMKPLMNDLLAIASFLDRGDPLFALTEGTQLKEQTEDVIDNARKVVRNSSPAIRDTFLGLTRYLSAIPEKTTAEFLDAVADKVSEQGNITGAEAASTLLEAANHLLDTSSDLPSDERYILAAAVLQGGYSERSVINIIDAAKDRLAQTMNEMKVTNTTSPEK